MEVKDLTQCPVKDIVNVYLSKSAMNRSKDPRQNRLFYSMSPVGHRFLENIDSEDPQFEAISSLAKQVSKVLESNCKQGFENRLKAYWASNLPAYPVCSIRDSAFGAVLDEVWFAFFARACPNPDLVVKAAHNILMVVKNRETVDIKSRRNAIALVADAVKLGLNPQLELQEIELQETFTNIHEVIFALIVSSVDELSEGFAHTVIALAQHAPTPTSLDEFALAFYEALRLYPLFTRSTRPSNDNTCLYSLNYVNYHRRTDIFGKDALQYNWQRWQAKNWLGQTFIFGVASNRSCPGRGSAIEMVPRMVQVWMQTYQTQSYIRHTRNLPCGGLAIVTPIGKRVPWFLSWLHFGAWIYSHASFCLIQRAWVNHQNAKASNKRREADRYYASLKALRIPAAASHGSVQPSRLSAKS